MQTRLHTAWIAGCLLLPLSGVVHACRGSAGPLPEDLPKYSAVLAVEVTGMHLTEYEEHELRDRGHRSWAPETSELDTMRVVSVGVDDFEVTVLVDKAVQGKSEPVRTFVLGGCGASVPALQEKGIVFVPQFGRKAMAVWESDREQYAFWSRHFGLQSADEQRRIARERPWVRHCTLEGYDPADPAVLGPLGRRAHTCTPIDACVLACLRSNCATDTADACEVTCAGRDDAAIAADRFADRSDPMCKVRDAK
jgi:hypothetical protein